MRESHPLRYSVTASASVKLRLSLNSAAPAPSDRCTPPAHPLDCLRESAHLAESRIGRESSCRTRWWLVDAGTAVAG
jgi:hypothetical protein